MSAVDKIRGGCPMGCGETLFVGSGGWLTCSWHACPRPTALADLLGHEHVVTFGLDGFDVQHPLAERGHDLVACPLHQHVATARRPARQARPLHRAPRQRALGMARGAVVSARSSLTCALAAMTFAAQVAGLAILTRETLRVRRSHKTRTEIVAAAFPRLRVPAP